MSTNEIGFGPGLPVAVYPKGEHLLTVLDDGNVRETRRPQGLVATIQKNSDRQQLAKQKGPSSRVAAMTLDQRHNLMHPERKRIVRPL